MATTAKTYRLGKRNQRYMTKLSTFANGMYWTEQIIPEGYAKAMVNYDIDVTGSNIKPKMGRVYTTDLKHGNTNKYFDKFVVKDDLYLMDEKFTSEEKERFEVISTPDGKTAAYSRVILEHNNPTAVKTLDCAIDQYGYGVYIDYERSMSDANSFNFIHCDNAVNKNPFADVAISDRPVYNVLAFNKPLTQGKTTETAGYTDSFNYTVINNTLYSVNVTGTNTIKYNYFNGNKAGIGYGITNKICKHYLYKDSTTGSESEYIIKHDTMPVILKTLNALEAANNGYNLLLDDPYSFADECTGSISVLGILAYDVNDKGYVNPLLSPTTGSSINLRINYQYPFVITPVNIKYKLQILDLNKATYRDEDFEDVISGTHQSGTPWYIDGVLCKYNRFVLRIIINPGETTANVYDASFTCDVEQLQNMELRRPQLQTAKHMINWYNYIGLYGVEGHDDTIFFSAPEDPGYFPFPNNVLTFGNKVLAVHNYLDRLLVITIDSIYLVTVGNTIMQSTQKKIMSNIYVNEADALKAVILNNQIFIKAADTFYVFKPNNYTSDATDLKNYVISTAIENLLKKPKEITKILNEVYKPVCIKASNNYKETIKIEDFDIFDYTSYVMDSDVHYVYRLIPYFTKPTRHPISGPDDGQLWIECDTDVYEYSINDKIEPVLDVDKTYVVLNTGSGGYDGSRCIDMHLVYDSVVRSWRLYFESIGYEQGHAYLKNGEYGYTVISDIHYAHCLNDFIKNKRNGAYYEFFTMQDDLSYTTGKSSHITYITKKTYNSCTDSIPLYGKCKISDTYDMYTYLDTGIIPIEDMFTKRFRELQINLINCELTMIPFHVNFRLDGQERIDDTNFRIQHITDPSDPDYGLIYVTPVEVENLKLYSETTFADDVIESDHWALDLSKFPDLSLVTVRFSLLGRGRHASLQILNDSLKRYEMSDMNWVYRTMSGR